MTAIHINYHHNYTATGGSQNHRGGDCSSTSTERTFSPLSDLPAQLLKLRSLCEKLSGELKEKELAGRTVTLKIK